MSKQQPEPPQHTAESGADYVTTQVQELENRLLAQKLAKAVAKECLNYSPEALVDEIVNHLSIGFPHQIQTADFLTYAMMGAFEGAEKADDSKEGETFKRDLAIAFLQKIAPHEKSSADLSQASSISSYGSALASMASALYSALKPGFTISTIATAIGMSSLFPILGPATLVIGAAMVVRSAAIVVSSVFKCIRGTRDEREQDKILTSVRRFIAEAPEGVGSKFTTAIIYATEKELTGTEKSIVEKTIEGGLRDRAEKLEKEKPDSPKVAEHRKMCEILKKNKRGYLAYLFNCVFQTNIGGAAESFWHRAPRKTKVQGAGKTARRSK